MNCHCQLEENPIGNVEPMQLVVQYLTKAAKKNVYQIGAYYAGRGKDGANRQTEIAYRGCRANDT